MSEKDAHSLGEVVAANVKFWRTRRGLDQQDLADRLSDLGWPVDRTTITRIERGERKVTVDDLGLLAVALNVPLPMLLLPVHRSTAKEVTLTPGKHTAAVYPWLVWEWMLGNEPLPGRMSPFGNEWRSGSEPLWLYERVRAAQHELNHIERRIADERFRAARTRKQQDAVAKAIETGVRDRAAEGSDYVEALQKLVDAVAEMDDAGLHAGEDLIGTWREAISDHRVERSPTPRRQRMVERADEQKEQNR